MRPPLQLFIKVRKNLNTGPWDSQQLGTKQKEALKVAPIRDMTLAQHFL